MYWQISAFEFVYECVFFYDHYHGIPWYPSLSFLCTKYHCTQSCIIYFPDIFWHIMTCIAIRTSTLSLEHWYGWVNELWEIFCPLMGHVAIGPMYKNRRFSNHAIPLAVAVLQFLRCSHLCTINNPKQMMTPGWPQMTLEVPIKKPLWMVTTRTKFQFHMTLYTNMNSDDPRMTSNDPRSIS